MFLRNTFVTLCQNPYRLRPSKKYYHDQDWIKEGKLSRLRRDTLDSSEDCVRDLLPRGGYQRGADNSGYMSGKQGRSPTQRRDRRDEYRRTTDDKDTVLNSQDVSSIDKGSNAGPCDQSTMNSTEGTPANDVSISNNSLQGPKGQREHRSRPLFVCSRAISLKKL